MQKVKKNYSKEKAAEYYLLNKEEIKKRYKTRKERISKNLLQEIKKQKEVKKVPNYCKKKINKCKNMSKIKIKKIYKQFKWL